MIILVAGTIGRSGLGGQAWASLQYLLGFRALGHEVYYVEDCGRSSWVYIWETQEWTHELDYPAAYVKACLEPFGFGQHWIYRDNYRAVGMAIEAFRDVCHKADLLLLRATPFWDWRPEYNAPKRRVFLDVDPGFTQITLASGDAGWVDGVARCERRFTIGQRLGEPGCTAPTVGGPWLKTRPTVYLPEWPVASGEGHRFTSIMRWQGFKEVHFAGAAYGQRDRQFPKYYELPQRTAQPFQLAQMGVKPEQLTVYGWDVVPGEVISKTPETYRAFIQDSRAEFGVPKSGYVQMQGGWFSDRSVCYLASGRPVLIEDTGLSPWLRVGCGLVTFRDLEEALDGVARINADYAKHRAAARRLAEDEFATDKVLPPLLEAAMA